MSRSPWAKIANVVLSTKKEVKASIQEFNQYFDMRIQAEQKTERFPFEKDPAITTIMNKRLKIIKNRVLAGRQSPPPPPSAQIKPLKQKTVGTLFETVKTLEEMESQMKSQFNIRVRKGVFRRPPIR